MTNTCSMPIMDEVKQMVGSLSQKMETSISSLTAQVSLCFDQIENMEGKLNEGDNVCGEQSHKGKNIVGKCGPNYEFLFSYHSHNLMPCFPKIYLNQFDGSNPTIGVDQCNTTFPFVP
jgi:hypothetical protein